MRLLITGGAGFIGSNFIRFWAGHHPLDHIVNLDLLTYAGDRASLHDVEPALGRRGITEERGVRADTRAGTERGPPKCHSPGPLTPPVGVMAAGSRSFVVA